MSDLTAAERAELRDWHQPQDGHPGDPEAGYCRCCAQTWPCPTVRALDALERTERLLAWATRRAWCPGDAEAQRLALSLGAPPFGRTTEEMEARLEWHDLIGLEIAQVAERARGQMTDPKED